jgi:hypothetical protein
VTIIFFTYKREKEGGWGGGGGGGGLDLPLFQYIVCSIL